MVGQGPLVDASSECILGGSETSNADTLAAQEIWGVVLKNVNDNKPIDDIVPSARSTDQLPVGRRQ